MIEEKLSDLEVQGGSGEVWGLAIPLWPQGKAASVAGPRALVRGSFSHHLRSSLSCAIVTNPTPLGPSLCHFPAQDSALSLWTSWPPTPAQLHC